MDYAADTQRFEVEITLKPAVGNGDAEPLLVAAIPSPAKAHKHMEKGLAALRSGDLKSGQKELEAAYLLAPANSDICYLLGIAYSRSKNFDRGRTYLLLAIEADPVNVQALVALGQLSDLDGDYAGAEEALERSVVLDHNQWLAHLVLADVHLRQGDYQGARQEAEAAIHLGEGAANKAEFIEAEAMAQSGLREDAMKSFESFLHDAPGDSATGEAQSMLAELRAESPAESPVVTGSPTDLRPKTPPTLTLPPVGLLISTWAPKDVDQARPPVADGVSCPAEQVIEGAGQSVTQLVESVNNIAASEKVVYEDLDIQGKPVSVANRKYDYMASIENNERGLPIISETREEISGVGGSPQHMSLFALEDLALVFHPQVRTDFQMTCEGLGKWQKKTTWIVYFRQRPDRQKRIRSYQADGRFYPAGLKGRAWISADTFQVVRMEADLISPIPEIGLGSEEDAIEYGPVDFQSKKTQLWLPRTADIYFYFHHRPFRRHHDFTNYKLFSVGATQKITPPKVDDEK